MRWLAAEANAFISEYYISSLFSYFSFIILGWVNGNTTKLSLKEKKQITITLIDTGAPGRSL
jgi:hypothetical protein